MYFKQLFNESLKVSKYDGMYSKSLDGMSKQQAKNFIYKIIKNRFNNFKGIFSDSNWAPIHEFYKRMGHMGIDLYLQKSEYNQNKHSKMPDSKVWSYEVYFINNMVNPNVLYVNVLASGAGSVDDPLSKYDITVIVS